MTNALSNLRASLEKAVDLIDESLLISNEDITPIKALSASKNQLNFSQTNSLLDKCDDVVKQYRGEKPILRVIHHLACSGGTLISQCIASMPNTFLLSEMHPTTQLHFGSEGARFTPTDFIVQARFGRFPKQDVLAKRIFVSSVEAAELHIRQIGSALVIRDHTHSDYSLGANVASYPVVKNILSERFQVRSLLTVRDPIDSYLSLIKNGWLSFSPASFDEYCSRYITMVSHYSDAKICRYEDFVDDPLNFMKSICEYWDLTFSDCFTSIFDLANVSGGSGRKSETIQKMERKLISDELMEEIKSSINYKRIENDHNYGL
jgi:hypothetical protein